MADYEVVAVDFFFEVYQSELFVFNFKRDVALAERNTQIILSIKNNF